MKANRDPAKHRLFASSYYHWTNKQIANEVKRTPSLSLPMQMNMRITAETNKSEWWDPVVPYRCDVINICSLYCSRSYHHFLHSLILLWCDSHVLLDSDSQWCECLYESLCVSNQVLFRLLRQTHGGRKRKVKTNYRSSQPHTYRYTLHCRYPNIMCE